MNNVLISEREMRRIIKESVECVTCSCGEKAVNKLIRYCDFHDFKSEGVKNHRDEIVAWFNGSQPTLELPGIVDSECVYDDDQRGTISRMMFNMWRKCKNPSGITEEYSPFDPDDDEGYEELTTPEYVIDSIVNGNFNQAVDVAFDVVIRKGKLVDLLTQARETGDSSLEHNVWSAIAKAMEKL